MKEMVRMFLWTGLALLLGLKGAVPVSAREAGALDYTALRGGKSINGILSDGSVGASVTFSPGETLEIRTDSLLAQISMVMQNAYLFHGSLRENLCFGNETISEERMVEACRRACCHEFISALPEGYDTMVGEGGATLSGGERQRISLARAFLKDVPILLLDEPTASLDADNEAMVQRALDEIARERTVVMIAHRLKTVRGAEQILVLEDGKIIEQGTHDQLVGENGLYARLWGLQNQAGAYTFQSTKEETK